MRVFEKDKLGFTLIELLVVMAIIAVIFAIGVGAFINARDYSTLEESAQSLLSTIRDAQNKAVGVDVTGVVSDPTKTPKIWNVEVKAGSVGNSPQFSIFSSYANGATLTASTTKTTTTPVTNISLSLVGTGGAIINNGSSDTIRISYSSPYGKAYICTQTPGTCSWQASSRPENDWEIPSGYLSSAYVSEVNNQDMSLQITITYKNLSKTITVKSNGDSNVD
jgi:prepilin-type N-terminal cleavage/methylation domain-containing protein